MKTEFVLYFCLKYNKLECTGVYVPLLLAPADGLGALLTPCHISDFKLCFNGSD